MTAHDSGAKVLLLEKAPEAHKGGNSRVSANIVFWPDDVAKAKSYFRGMAGPYMDHIPEEMPDVWATEMFANKSWLEGRGMVPVKIPYVEFPDFAGSECVRVLLNGEGPIGGERLWQLIEASVDARHIDTRYETAVMHLVEEDRDVSHGNRYAWSDDNLREVAKGWIKTAGTLRDLAGLIDVSAEALEGTVARFNASAKDGDDPDWGRGRATLVPIETGPFYAMELTPALVNTQGGPRRNAQAQIIGIDGEPIGRLFSAGELGSIYSFLYQGGGNIAECFAFGRVAGRNAAKGISDSGASQS